MRFDPSNARCFVLTRKEGLLAMVAHDLRLAVTEFVVDVDEAQRSVAACFEADSLRVVCARNGDRDAPETLTSGQKAEIEGNIVRDVLAAKKYPEIRYVSTGVRDADGGFEVDGKLSLHGKTRRVAVSVRRRGDEYVARALLQQPDFGIRPYSALLGALKVQAGVEVELVVPVPTTAARRS